MLAVCQTFYSSCFLVGNGRVELRKRANDPLAAAIITRRFLQQHGETNTISPPTGKATLTAKCFSDMHNTAPATANKPAELGWCFIFCSPASPVRCDKEGWGGRRGDKRRSMCVCVWCDAGAPSPLTPNQLPWEPISHRWAHLLQLQSRSTLIDTAFSSSFCS